MREFVPDEGRMIDKIKLCLTKQPFVTVHVLGPLVKRELEDQIKAELSPVDQKRVTIRVHK